jgi:hypothetical protein
MTLETIQSKTIDETLPLTPLERALLATGCKLLYEDGVKEYQKERLQEAKRAARPPVWVICLRVLAVCMALFCAPWAAFHPHAPSFWLWLGAWILSLGTDLVLQLIYTIPQRYRLLAWRTYWLGSIEYGRTNARSSIRAAHWLPPTVVPEECIALLGRIAEAMPSDSAQVHLEQLDDDPFVYLYKDARRYYIFAWDEKGYVPR